MADVRNLGTGSGGVGTARFSGSISGTRTVGGGAFAAGLPDLNLLNSPLTTRQVDCTSGNNSISIHDKTVLVALVNPSGNTVAVAVGEGTTEATLLELNPNGWIAWTMKAGTSRTINVTTDGSVTVTIIEA